MSCAENSSPAAVQSAVCADEKDDGNWAARLLAQETEEKQEGPLPPRQIGKEPEARGAQTPQQMEKQGTLERRHHHQQGKPVPAASPARPFGALEAFDGV